MRSPRITMCSDVVGSRESRGWKCTDLAEYRHTMTEHRIQKHIMGVVTSTDFGFTSCRVPEGGYKYSPLRPRDRSWYGDREQYRWGVSDTPAHLDTPIIGYKPRWSLNFQLSRGGGVFTSTWNNGGDSWPRVGRAWAKVCFTGDKVVCDKDVSIYCRDRISWLSWFGSGRLRH